MKNLYLNLFFFFSILNISHAQSAWEEPTLLGVLEESLSYIEVGTENNLDKGGVQTYFREIFNKSTFDSLYIKTAEYSWDTITYHYLNTFYYLHQVDIKLARVSCYKAGNIYQTTSGTDLNVLSRHGLTFDHINHLREYIDLGEHYNDTFIGFDGNTEMNGYKGFEEDEISKIPSLPWPMPHASTRTVLPPRLLGAINTFQEINKKLTSALDECGYDDKNYFLVPGGFAIVTQMERFNNDGTSTNGTNRWNLTLEPSSFSLEEYLKALFWGRKGSYRIFIFVVTDQVLNENKEIITQPYLKIGSTRLSNAIEKKAYTKDHYCTALIYEFELKESFTEAQFLSSSRYTGKKHLKLSEIWGNFK